jgi:hypothetical protein
MSKIVKSIDSLQESDLSAFPVWEFDDDEETHDECFVRPFTDLPAEDLRGKGVAVQVCLANGQRIWGLIGNIDTKNARSTEHFLILSVIKDGRWFHLARYHDFDFDQQGPNALAAFLGLSPENVFPISYDISMYAVGVQEALIGKVTKEPRERLTQAELIAMAI